MIFNSPIGLKKTNFLFVFTLSVLFSGCDSKNNNPKDYWTLNEPEIYAWDTSENANFRGLNTLLSDFKSEHINEALGYESYLLFKERETVVDLEINTECMDPTNNQIFKSTKNTKIPKSFKIYFYNLLPNEVVYHDENNQIQSPTYNCTFKFTAKNTISSKRDFSIKNVNINTSNSNEIQIIAIDKNGSNIERTIRPIQRNTTALRPSVYFNDNLNTFVFDKITQDGKLIGPAEIKCSGAENVFSIQRRNGELINVLEQPFFNLSNEGRTTFLEKCRIVAQLDLEANAFSNNSQESNEVRTVWSEYFNIILDQPSLEIAVLENINTKTEGYPFNASNYLDPSVTIYHIQITNTSKQTLRLNLPFEQKIIAQLKPLYFAAQMDGFRPNNRNNDWVGLGMYQTGDTFETELKFMHNGQRALTLELPSGDTKTIDVVLDKNFNCNFKGFELLQEEPQSERGFVVKAIDLGTEQDILQIDYLNQNEMQAFPELFFLNTILENSMGTLDSIRNSNQRQRRYKTNLLQLNMNRSTVIDTIFLRDIGDILTPDLERLPGYGIESTNYTRLSIERRQQVRDYKRTNGMPSIIQNQTQNTSFCLEVF
jgi:hypothetical protein